MRFASILLMTIFTILPFSFAKANEESLVMPVSAPWMSDEQSAVNVKGSQAPIQPRKISLADLEKMNGLADDNYKKSALEELYSNRIIDELGQYGYDLFNQTPLDKTIDNVIPTGTVQADYVLSAGDELSIILRGQINARQNQEIDNQGLLIVEDLPPITAAGRTLKEVQKDLQNEVQNLHNTQIYISLAKIRQINVLVVGHVKKPGRKNLTAFHTVLDALSKSGGVEKTGSLRRIKLVRNGKSHFIDLYQLLMASGSGGDNLLQDGDRIIVPPIGPTMAISGSVKRAAIYEIKQGEKLSLHQALGLGGGVLTPGQNRYMKLEYTSNGEETVQDVNSPKQRIFGDGTLLMVAQSEQVRSSSVTLSGHTRQPGAHDLKKSKTLSDLITNEKVLGKNIYPLIGIIERRDPKQLTTKLISFSPHQVLHKEYNEKLTEGDKVRLFSIGQIRNLKKEEVNNNQLLHEASLRADNKYENIDDPIMAAFLNERAAFVRGSVRQAGAYPVTDGTTLESLLAVAGGTALEANVESIELTSRINGRQIVNLNTQDSADIMISAGDTLRVNQKFHKIADQSVSLIGEVNHPGRYDLMPGDTLSTLIDRAGGLTEQSYPDGTIFSRASERQIEKSRYKAQAQDLELKLAAILRETDNDKKPNLDQVAETQKLITQLKHADVVGRITVEADPASLNADPAQDILLEAGDKIYIPKRPLTVRVAGEVLSPAALQFRKGKDAVDYIRQAGGATHFADKDRAFVIYPDGSAQPLQVSMWNHSAAFIPPGSTIIVPRDPKPFDFIESAGRVSQLLANLAITGLYIEAIGDDD